MPKSLKSIAEVKSASPANSNEFNHIMVGTHVEHSRFGKGRVTQLEGSGADKKAVIFFPHHGSKTVLLKFANLTVL